MASTQLSSMVGNYYDATVYAGGSTYHRVEVVNVKTGEKSVRICYSRKRALALAKLAVGMNEDRIVSVKMRGQFMIWPDLTITRADCGLSVCELIKPEEIA